MTKIKKVLIALDYDPSALKVAENGFSMAKALGAETILLHVITDPVYYSTTEYTPIMGFAGFTDLGAVITDSIEGLKMAVQDFLDRSKKHLGDENIKTLIAEGDFAEAILKAANDLPADIIVMGSHSKRWLEKILLGSVTAKVLRDSLIPLFIIPTNKEN